MASVSSPPPEGPTPSIVFIHGAWHSPRCWDKVIAILNSPSPSSGSTSTRGHGYNCSAVTLPSTSGDPSASFLDDITAARSAITQETKQGRDVVVVVHSYGGAVGASAVKGLTRAASISTEKTYDGQQAKNGDKKSESIQQNGHVVGMVLMATGFVRTGLSFIEQTGGMPPPQWRVDQETGFAEFNIGSSSSISDMLLDFFYHDLPAEESEYWVSQLTKQAWRPFYEGGEHMYSGWKDVPCWFLVCTEDRAIPVDVVRMMIEMAKQEDDGVLVTSREVKSGHLPMLSVPKETATFIAEAVEGVRSRLI